MTMRLNGVISATCQRTTHNGIKMKSVIITRTSQDEVNNPRMSNSTQEEACGKKAEENQDEIVAVYSDIGIGGSIEKLSKRKGLNKMFQEIEPLKIKRVYALDYSRAGRGVYIQEMIINKLKKLGVELITVNDSDEKLNRQVKGIFNENVIDVARARTEVEHSTRLDKGIPVSRPPRGYRVDKKTKKWVIDERKAPIIRKIFDMFFNGHKVSEISEEFRIDKKSIKHILKNKTYLGIYTYRDESFKAHEPIINKEVFQKCQE